MSLPEADGALSNDGIRGRFLRHIALARARAPSIEREVFDYTAKIPRLLRLRVGVLEATRTSSRLFFTDVLIVFEVSPGHGLHSGTKYSLSAIISRRVTSYFLILSIGQGLIKGYWPTPKFMRRMNRL